MLNYFYQNIIKYNLLNKFKYFSLNNIPKIFKMILNFNSKFFKLKEFINFLLILELIAYKKSSLIKSNIFNLTIKLKKGSIIGCELILYNKFLYYFLNKLIFEIFPRNPNYFLNLKNNLQLSLNLKNVLNFFEIEKKYYLFNILNDFNISILTTANTQIELIFLLNSIKFPIKQLNL